MKQSKVHESERTMSCVDAVSRSNNKARGIPSKRLMNTIYFSQLAMHRVYSHNTGRRKDLSIYPVLVFGLSMKRILRLIHVRTCRSLPLVIHVTISEWTCCSMNLLSIWFTQQWTSIQQMQFVAGLMSNTTLTHSPKFCTQPQQTAVSRGSIV